MRVSALSSSTHMASRGVRHPVEDGNGAISGLAPVEKVMLF